MSKVEPNSEMTLAWLLFYLEAIDYFNEYPTRQYLKELIESDKPTDRIVRAILSDDLVQRHLYVNWLSDRYKIDDPVKYFHEHIDIMA